MDHIIKKHKSKPQKRRYFTKATEEAIVKYNNSTDEEERSRLYAEFIHWPFYKLTEIINEGNFENVYIYTGDCNEILLDDDRIKGLEG